MNLTESFLTVVPEKIRYRYGFAEVRNAAAVIASSCPNEWSNVLDYLDVFELKTELLMTKGGNKSQVVEYLESFFYGDGWKETRIDTEHIIYCVQNPESGKGRMPSNLKLGAKTLQERIVSPFFNSNVFQEGYKVDALKGRLAVDIEWNAKDGNLDRDISAYRAWYELGVIDAAILITKEQVSCQKLVSDLWEDHLKRNPEKKGLLPPVDLKTTTTTNLEKAMERIKRGDGGGCPILLIALTKDTWDGQSY